MTNPKTNVETLCHCQISKTIPGALGLGDFAFAFFDLPQPSAAATCYDLQSIQFAILFLEIVGVVARIKGLAQGRL